MKKSRVVWDVSLSLDGRAGGDLLREVFQTDLPRSLFFMDYAQSPSGLG
jgi:hypothetical protein